MFRKALSACLVLSLLFSLTACGRKAAVPSETAQSTAAAESSAAPTVQNAFAETVIVDNESCTFKVTAIEEEAFWGYTLKAFLENKTGKELMFTLQDVSVNGFMCDPFWATSVTAGMKSNADISFSASDFERNGISQVTDIEATVKVYDANDLTAGDVVYEHFILYPQGKDAVQPYARTAVEGEKVLFDDANCTMIVTGFDPENTWGYTVNVYLENKTDKTLMFSIDGAAVNGFMCDPYWAVTVAPGKRSNTDISWMASDFEENGITAVDTLTLPIRVYDSNDWLAQALIDETFTVKP